MGNMKQQKGKGHFLSGKGFYVALGISLLAIAAATIFAVNSTVNEIDRNSVMDAQSGTTEQWGFTQQAQDVQKTQSDIAKPPQSSQAPSSSQSQSLEPAVAQEPSGTFATQYSMPLTGDVVVPFSNYEMVYNKTLKCWETHNGVDIYGKLGDEVKACAQGTVKEITNDDLWGVCIQIEHPDGLISHYNGLGKTVVVKKGQAVHAGDVLGTVGDTAACEILEKTHLHFALQNHEKWIDPFTLIKQ